jgi:hypothetical protein
VLAHIKTRFQNAHLNVENFPHILVYPSKTAKASTFKGGGMEVRNLSLY